MDFNHPFGKEACKKRLLEEYYKYGKLIVAFDYDNTIYDYHQNGGEPLLIQDDLCDRGGTFIGLAEAVKEINPEADINIFVCHMVNPKGIKNLSETFNHVWFTNSYKDWKSHCDQFPDNVTQIDIV